MLFGTKVFWRMLLSSVRKLPGDGINWPSDKDESFNLRIDA